MHYKYVLKPMEFHPLPTDEASVVVRSLRPSDMTKEADKMRQDTNI